MNYQHYLRIFACLTLLFSNTALAGNAQVTKEVVVEPEKLWSVHLSSGFDSLYIFRGVNVIPGSPLYWVQPTVNYNLTKNDTLSIGVWYAVGLHHTKYQEMDIITSYTHTLGSWAFSTGYIFYYVPVTDGAYPFYSHELNAGISYTFDFKWIKICPNSFYYFNIGPNYTHNGYSPNAAGYLQNRIDFSIPIYRDIIEFDPWIGLNFNFRYNARQDGHYFTGINNFEYGVRVPIKLTKWMTVSGYIASTNQWANLPNTAATLVYFGSAISLTY